MGIGGVRRYAHGVFLLEPQAVEAQARRAGGWLRQHGLTEGDRIGIVATNHPRYLPLTVGALRTGVVPVLVNAHLPPPERARIIADADPALVVDERSWPDVDEAPEAELAPHPLARPMHYTSGTTGFAKGVWSGIFTPDDAAALTRDEAELWAAGPGDVFCVCSPLYHSAPHRAALSALLAGARVVVFERFDAREVARVMGEMGVTGAFLVPTHLRRLIEAGLRCPAMRRALHAGEPCPPALKREALDVFPEGSLWEFYGSTEGQFTVCSSAEWLERPGTVGRTRGGRRLEIDDPADDGVGTVYVSAPSFARWEYWGDPGKTRRAWRGEMFTVGDLGRLDGEGYLFLAGRREDLIITGGVNVYPAEVERVLAEHPQVGEAAVFGVADPAWGQRVCAAVVAAGVSAAQLHEWLRDRLPGSHRPKEVHFLERLPRTTTGKVRRADLASLSG